MGTPQTQVSFVRHPARPVFDRRRQLVISGQSDKAVEYGFNWENGQVSRASISVGGSADAGPLSLSATCENCYARLGAGLRLQWLASFGTTGWFLKPYGQLDVLKAEVFGNLHLNADLLLTATYAASWEKTIRLMGLFALTTRRTSPAAHQRLHWNCAL